MFGYLFIFIFGQPDLAVRATSDALEGDEVLLADGFVWCQVLLQVTTRLGLVQQQILLTHLTLSAPAVQVAVDKVRQDDRKCAECQQADYKPQCPCV